MSKIREYSKTWVVETSNIGEIEVEAVRGVSSIVRIKLPYPQSTTLYLNDTKNFIETLNAAHKWAANND